MPVIWSLTLFITEIQKLRKKYIDYGLNLITVPKIRNIEIDFPSFVSYSFEYLLSPVEPHYE